jgi:hypothetical protein
MERVLMENIFDTEDEAIAAQKKDYAIYMESEEHKNSSEEWRSKTVRWSNVKQRATDSKWYYTKCPESSFKYKTEEYDESWNPLGIE